jgi:hypothetical protein
LAPAITHSTAKAATTRSYYSADANGVTINLATDTVTKDLLAYVQHGLNLQPVYWQDSFNDIQNFVGSANAHDVIVLDGKPSDYHVTTDANTGISAVAHIVGQPWTIHTDFLAIAYSG